MNDDDYRAALAEYGEAKATASRYDGRYGPAADVIAAEERLARATYRLAALAYDRDGRR